MDRYDRQIRLPGFGAEGQKKLHNARVLVVGAGGLGCPVLQYLSAAGVGKIGIVDGDRIDLSNLQRQILFTEKDINLSKAEIAANKIHTINSNLNILSYPFFLNTENIFEILDDYDFIVDCTDNFSIRYLLNDACALLRKTVVYSSIFRYEAQISVFHWGKNPFNLRDIFPEMPQAGSIPTCEEAGVLGSLAGIAGCWQANEILKLITGLGTSLSGRLLIFDSLHNHITHLDINKGNSILPSTKEEISNKNYDFICTVPPFELSNLEEVKTLLQTPKSIFVDVRNSDEQPRLINFPVMEFPLEDLKKSPQQLKKFNTIILGCQSGRRSIVACDILRKNFPEKNIYHLKNGIANSQLPFYTK